MKPELLEFIRHARLKGMDHATVRVLLLSAGWREKDIARGLAEEGLELPVPEPPGSGGAKEAFQYLMAFTALCFLACNVVYLLFEYLNVLIPDPLESYGSYSATLQSGTIRWSMAMLIVVVPLYFGFTWWIDRDLQRTPERCRSPIRRWLTYLALFAAAVTMMIDGVALVFGFLQGDLTTRFILRCLIVAAVAGIVFCYYLLSLRVPEATDVARLKRLDVSFGSLTVLLVALTLVAGFAMVESPFTARRRRQDERRIADLQQIESAIRRLVVEHDGSDTTKRLKRPLPRNLDELARLVRDEEHRRDLTLSDPTTGQKYSYAVKGETSFELCADFSLDNREAYPERWNHSAGKHCFLINVMKESQW